MKYIRILSISAAITGASFAQTLNFNGAVHAINGTGIPWVATSTMWGAVETGTFTGTTQTGFTSLNSINPALLTFNFGNLALTTFQSPGGSTIGFERYTTTGTSSFEVRYNGAVWAVGTPLFLRSEVSNNADFDATGTGEAILTAAGVSSVFFDEIMTRTGGTGLLEFTIDSFFPVNNAGDFISTGSMTITTAVPEPSASAGIAGGILLGFTVLRRRFHRPTAASKTA